MHTIPKINPIAPYIGGKREDLATLLKGLKGRFL